jgi:hypothetical protein
MFTDYRNKSQRLTKKKLQDKYPLMDFRPELITNGFGYQASQPYKSEEKGFTLTQLILGVVIGLPVLYGIVYVLLALTPNI